MKLSAIELLSDKVRSAQRTLSGLDEMVAIDINAVDGEDCYINFDDQRIGDPAILAGIRAHLREGAVAILEAATTTLKAAGIEIDDLAADELEEAA